MMALNGQELVTLMFLEFWSFTSASRDCWSLEISELM
jgi:hypothetical protein